MALNVRLKVVHVLVQQAPSHHNLRAVVEVVVSILGEVLDGVLRVLHLHACQQRVGHLLVETLESRRGTWSFQVKGWAWRGQAGQVPPAAFPGVDPPRLSPFWVLISTSLWP